MSVCMSVVSAGWSEVLISDPCRGRYMGLIAFIFFSPLPRFCPGHISGTVTRRDSKLSVLLGPAV